MSAIRNQLRCPYGTSRELPTTGLGTRGLALLSMIDDYLETYRVNYKCDPPAISLNQKQRNMLGKPVQLTGSELSKFTRHGISLHWVEESPEAGRPKDTPQI
jgi:hypothetical protein